MQTIKVGITGASGYIGSFLMDFFAKQGWEVFALGRNIKNQKSNFIKFELGQKCHDLDLSQLDYLIHCAYDFSPKDYETIQEINLEGSLELFKAAKAQGVKKIINFSTTSAYSEAVSNYGRVKYELEGKARQYGVITVRPGLVFSKQAGGIVGSLQKLVAKLHFIPMIGSGNQKFYPCHVEDLALLLEYLLKNKEIVATEVPIIAAAEMPITFKEVIQAIANSYEKKVLLLPVPYNLMMMGLKMVETLNLKLGLRSDSLKYFKHSNKNLDFSFTRDSKIAFRPFNAQTLQY